MAEDRHEVAIYLALAQIPGIGAARLRTLLAAFGGAGAAVQAPAGAIAALPGFTKAAATAVRQCRAEQGEQVLESLDRLGGRALLPEDKAFPSLLLEIPEPPAVLYAWGDIAQLQGPAAAIVGSRDHTPYGAEAARLLGAGVARAAVVVSGMARGLDAVAHAAALDAGGRSVGVLGNGFGVIYPAANRALYERMVERGCLLTEHPPGERPHAGAFPRRNRIISGLCGVTVVVEAALGSGTFITADCALDQGRTVLAVPGPITSATSAGTNRLIQQGAKPALSPADVLEELGLKDFPAETPKPSPTDLTDLERTLFESLQAQPTHVDALTAAARADAGAVLTALTQLELRGIVKQQPGMVFGLQ